MLVELEQATVYKVDSKVSKVTRLKYQKHERKFDFLEVCRS